jgi:hypothetical protein
MTDRSARRVARAFVGVSTCSGCIIASGMRFMISFLAYHIEVRSIEAIDLPPLAIAPITYLPNDYPFPQIVQEIIFILSS